MHSRATIFRDFRNLESGILLALRALSRASRARSRRFAAIFPRARARGGVSFAVARGSLARCALCARAPRSRSRGRRSGGRIFIPPRWNPRFASPETRLFRVSCDSFKKVGLTPTRADIRRPARRIRR